MTLTCPPKTDPVEMLDLDEALATDVAKRKSFSRGYLESKAS